MVKPVDFVVQYNRLLVGFYGAFCGETPRIQLAMLCITA